jgi:hypothetical protein
MRSYFPFHLRIIKLHVSLQVTITMLDNIICVLKSGTKIVCKDRLGLSNDSITDVSANELESELEPLLQ